MVKRGEKPVRSFNAGELSPDFAGRVDVRQYYSGCLRLKNFEPVPQGGFRLMPGTIDLGPVRRPLTGVTQVNAQTFPGPHTGTQTIWSCTFNEAVISAISFDNLGVDEGAISVATEIQRPNGTWVPIGPSQTIGTQGQMRNFGFPPRQGYSAIAARARATFSTSATASVGTATVLRESTAAAPAPRYRALRQTISEGYFLSASAGFVDVWEGDTFVAMVRMTPLQASMLPDLGFYAEASTFGLFHTQMQTRRVRRIGGNSHEWTLDLWPYENVPTADYGDDYPKTDDEWEIFFRWANENNNLYLSLTVDGEPVPDITLTDNEDEPANINNANNDDWERFAEAVQTALRDLSALGDDVTVTQVNMSGRSRKLVISFGGALSGREFDIGALVTNTAAVSALPVHTRFGKTDFEPLMSTARGWPGLAELAQDRLAYARFAGQPAAISLSRPGEYFDLSITAAAANAGRLDRLRSQTSETILAIQENKYLAIWTNAAMWFATNRVISAAEPLNFVVTSEVGIRANCQPVELEGRTYYVAHNGSMVMSASYDELETGFVVRPETIVNSHLVTGITRTARQRSSDDADAARMWMLRDDGRLIQGQMIESQEIFGLAEWIAADGGKVVEIGTDADNEIRLCVERDGELRHERMAPGCLFQQAVTTGTDLAGVVSGLPYPDGTTLWAEADGYILGPFPAEAGRIDLGDFYDTVTVGRWQPPLMEGMPHVFILQNDEVVWRPGRIHTASINVIDTTSLAVGANGEEPEEVPLLRADDPMDAPPPGKTGLIEASGLLGAKVGTTLIITQKRPGRLRVRDYSTGERL